MRGSRRTLQFAWFGAVLLFLLSGVLLAAYKGDRRLIAELAERVDGGRTLTKDQRFALYVGFAHRELRDPSYDEIQSGLVRFYYRFNPLHPGPGDVVRWGSHHRGPCGSHSRVVIAMLESRGVPSRVRLLLDESGKSIHTVVECLADGRWVIGDAAFGIAFRQRDGRPATAEYLATDTAFFHAQVDTVPGYHPE